MSVERDPKPYLHYTTHSVWIIAFFTAFEVTLLVKILNSPSELQLWVAAIFLLMFLVNISSLTVEVTSYYLRIWYGIGFVTRHVQVSEITNLTMKKNNSWQSIFLGAPEKALEIVERSGRRTTVGIGDTKRMLEFLRRYARGD